MRFVGFSTYQNLKSKILTYGIPILVLCIIPTSENQLYAFFSSKKFPTL